MEQLPTEPNNNPSPENDMSYLERSVDIAKRVGEAVFAMARVFFTNQH